MQIGEMNKKIDILEKSRENGPFGTKHSVYLTNIWAKKEELISAQLIKAMGESDNIPVNFIIRRNDTISNEMVVSHNGKFYDIKSAVPLPKNTNYTILTCFEVTK